MRLLLLWAILGCLVCGTGGLTGCASSSDEPEKPELAYPSGDAASGTADGSAAAMSADGDRQPDGERRGGNRPGINPGIADFIRRHVFWTGDAGIRLEIPGQLRGDPARYVWFNPVGITPATRYGSDVTLVTDPAPNHYSPRDVAYLADGDTTLVTPLGMRVTGHDGRAATGMPAGDLSGGITHIRLAPRETTAVDGLRIETTRAWADDVPGQERTRHHVGYIIFIDADGDGDKDLTVWYVGPYSEGDAVIENPELISFNNIADPNVQAGRIPTYPIDVMIVQINRPSVMSPQAIVDLANKVSAGVVIPVGQSLDSAADRDALLALDAACTRPLWFPPAPTDATAAPSASSSAAAGPDQDPDAE